MMRCLAGGSKWLVLPSCSPRTYLAVGSNWKAIRSLSELELHGAEAGVNCYANIGLTALISEYEGVSYVCCWFFFLLWKLSVAHEKLFLLMCLQNLKNYAPNI